MKITILGTGTPPPSLKRASSGCLVEVVDLLIAIDHGPGASRRLLESGHRATDISHVLFSHLHYDHCMEYPHLCLQRWDIGADRISDLEVFGPPPLKKMTNLLFGEDGVFGPDISARIHHQGSIDVFEQRDGEPPRKWARPAVHEVRPGDVIDIGTCKVTVGRGSHVQPYLECYSYRIDSAEGAATWFMGGRESPFYQLCVDAGRGDHAVPDGGGPPQCRPPTSAPSACISISRSTHGSGSSSTVPLPMTLCSCVTDPPTGEPRPSPKITPHRLPPHPPN